MLKLVTCLAMLIAVQSQGCLSDCPKNQILTISSDETTLVTGPKTKVQANAVKNSFIHSAWTANIPGAFWISDEPNISASLAPLDTYRYYTKYVNIPCSPSSVILTYASDNSVITYVNGQIVPACSDPNVSSFNLAKTCTITSYFTVGNNVINWSVRNFAQPGGTYTSNPNGLRYQLKISV